MINSSKIIFAIFALATIAACSTTGGQTSTAETPRAAPVSYAMEVTDIDYGSVRTDRRYLMSYSFPDAQGRFAVRATSQAGISEPVTDTSDYAYVNDDVAASVICKDGLRKLNATPNYLVADRAYQSAYICTNSEG